LSGLDVDDWLKMYFEILLPDDCMQQLFGFLIHDAWFALSGCVCLQALQRNDFFVAHPLLKELCIGLLLQFDQHHVFLWCAFRSVR
jgi:hypothetical protein